MNDDIAAVAVVVVGSALATFVVADALVLKVVSVPTEDVADDAVDAADSIGGMTISAIVQVWPPSLDSMSVYVAPRDAPTVSEKAESAASRVMVVLTHVCVAIVPVQATPL